MAARLRKWWGWLVAVLLMFLIGLSRLYLGVHFVHDVLAGWLIGGLLLWLTLHFWDPVVARIKKLRHRTQIIFAFIASLLLLLIALIPYVWLKMANWQPPSQWMEYAANAISLEGALTNTGTFFGLMAGLVWMDHLGWFDTRGSWWQLVLRYILGVAGVLILRYGLKYIFPGGETYAGYFFQYLRYALIGIWVTGAAPWLFLQLGLANRK